MTPNPFLGLIHSRKFWLLILDTCFALLMHFLGKYSPAAADDARFLFLTIQPVFVLIIGAIAYEDKAKIEARSSLDVARLYDAGAQVETSPVQPTVVINTAPQAAPESQC